MDLKNYYQKIRDVEAGIAETDAVLVSLETPDGGRPGVRTEVPRRIAAQMTVDGRARLASAAEAKEFRDQAAEAKRDADALAEAAKVQFTVVPTSELKRGKEPARPARG
jgi:hypothetical protein